jgi:hypothetical protein
MLGFVLVFFRRRSLFVIVIVVAATRCVCVSPFSLGLVEGPRVCINMCSFAVFVVID